MDVDVEDIVDKVGLYNARCEVYLDSMISILYIRSLVIACFDG